MNTVNIYVPDLEIAEASSTLVSGTTDPESANLPFHLIRERDGAVSELGEGYITDENGDFEITDLSSSDLINVYDADGNVIAQFNPPTKQVLVYDDAYDVIVLAAKDDWPSRLSVYEISTGIVMASFIFVTESTRAIFQSIEALEDLDLSLYEGVTIYPLVDEEEEGYEIGTGEIIARDDLGSMDLYIGSDGNISIFDDRFTVQKREADSLEDYLILEIYDNGELELELWPGTPEEVNLVNTVDLGLTASETILEGESLAADTRLYFEDISTSDELYDEIAELVERGILEGYLVSGLRYFYPDTEINRAEFTKIILGILCIVPSDEAYELPSVFYDILDADDWFYPYTKEAYLREIITGYLGELSSSGQAPFKPENTITRAEAAKIILEALDKEEIIELPDDLSGEIWYEPYMEIAQDLSPYLLKEATAGETSYIVTAEEAADPSHVITRYECVEMSVRVLQAYNCFDLDSDGDGLINYDEESLYGSDPYNPDTDGGGVPDGTEVGRGTDPLDGEDDFGKLVTLSVDAGIYAVSEECNSCPCIATLDFDSDLRPGDSVFAIIQNDAGEIFAESNQVTVSE